jgi:hypothetical protein
MATYLDSLGDNQFVVVRDINHPRQELLIDANSLNNDSVTYKVYTALLTQSGIDAPTAVVLENTIGDIVWTYHSIGVYFATLTNAFIEDKTYLFAYILPTSIIGFQKDDENQINIGTTDNLGVKTNGLLNSTSIEIRVYN